MGITHLIEGVKHMIVTEDNFKYFVGNSRSQLAKFLTETFLEPVKYRIWCFVGHNGY